MTWALGMQAMDRIIRIQTHEPNLADEYLAEHKEVFEDWAIEIVKDMRHVRGGKASASLYGGLDLSIHGLIFL